MRSLSNRWSAIAALLPALALANHIGTIVSPTQRNANGSALAVGGTTVEGPEVELGGSSSSVACSYNPYQMDIEVRPIAAAFTNTPTHTSGTINKGSCVQTLYPFTRITGLTIGSSYKWQARERNYYYSSGWTLFNSGGTAFTVGPAPANRLVFTTAAQAVISNACSGATTVQNQNSSGTPVNVGALTPLALVTTSSSMTFYSNAACTTQITSSSIAAGTSSATVYFKDPVAGSVVITIDAAGILAGEQTETINPGPPSQVIYTSLYSSIVNGCTSANALQTRDAQNNVSPVTAATLVNLTSTMTSTKFYSDATCTTLVTGITLPNGASSGTFHWKDTVLGSPTLTATISGLTPASSGTSTYANLAFTTAAQTVVAGDCSALTTVQIRDAAGAAYPATFANTLSLGYTGNGSMFSDAACTNPISSIAVAIGGSGGSFYWKNTLAGSQYFSASASYVNWNYQYQTINPGPPAKLLFISAAQTITAGACSPAVQARSADIYNNYSIVTGGAAVNLATDSTGGTFYTTSTCTTAVTSAPIPAGSNLVTFYWKDTRPGTPTLTISATLTVAAVATQMQTVRAKLAFTTAAQTLQAGQCSAVTTIQVQDGNNAAFPVGANTTVSLSSSSAGGPFFSDATCTTAITTVTLATGASSASFFFKDTVAASPTLTASATGLASGQQVQTINPGPLSTVRFTGTAQTVGSGICSAVTPVRIEDAYQNGITSTSSRLIGLTSSSGGGTFYSDSTCITAITSASVPAGSAASSFFWKDATIGTPTLTATFSTASGIQVQSVVAGSATRLGFLTSGQSIAAASCSAITRIQSQDAGGNAANVSADTVVALSSTSATTGFFSDAACTVAITSLTIATGGNQISFYWKDSKLGTPSLTGTTAGMSPANQPQTVTAGAAVELAFISPAQTITAGACSAIVNVQAQDQYDNPAPVSGATVVTLSSTSGGASFYSDAACTNPITTATIASGASGLSFYFRDAVAGTSTLTASAPLLTSGTQGVTVGGRDQVRYRWYSSTGAPLAAENTAARIAPGANVHLRVGIQVNSFNWTLAPSAVSASGEAFANAEAVTGTYANTATSDGVFEVLTETKIGQGPSAYRTLGDSAIGGNLNHSYNFGTSIPAGRPAYNLCLNARTSGEALKVGWTATTTPTTPIFPAGWQIVATTLTEVCFDLAPEGYTGGALTIYLADALRGAGADPTIDSFTIDRIYMAGPLPGYVGLERAAASTFASATQVTAGELWNDPAITNGAKVTSVLTGTTSAQTFVESRPSDPTNQTNLASGSLGEWDFAVVFPSGGGSVFYRMVVTDAAGARLNAVEALAQIATADSAASRLTFTSAPKTQGAGTCSTAATVQLQDPSGAPRTALTSTTVNLSSTSLGATFYSDAGCTTVAASPAIAAGASTLTFYWRDNVLGTPSLTAASTGLTSAVQAQAITAGPAAKVAFTSAPQSLVLGTCSAAVTVQTRDSFDNPSAVTAAASGPLTSSSGTLQFFSDATCTTVISSLTVAAGTMTASFYFKDSVSGTPGLTYSPAGLTAASQNQTLGVGPVTRLAFLTTAPSLVAGACSAAITVQSQDSLGNGSSVAANTTVTLSTTSSGGGFFIAAGCGGTAVGTVILAAGANTVTFYYRDTRAGSATLGAAAATLTPASLGATVAPAPASRLVFTSSPMTITAGGCSGAASLQTQDAFGNVSAVTAATTVTLTSSSAAGLFFGAAACAGGAVTTRVIAIGASTTSFYFGDTLAGTPLLTATGASLTPATGLQTVNPGPASALVFATAPLTVAAGACSGTVTLQTRDAFGNPSSVASALSANLSSSSTGGTFYADAACTNLVSVVGIPSGNSGSFFFKDTRAGTPTLTASSSLGNPTQLETITAATAARLAFSTTAQSIPAGACSAVATVVSQDAFANPVAVSASTAVTLALGTTGQTFADAACATPITSVTLPAGGTSGNFYFSDDVAGTPSLAVSATSFTAASQAQTITPLAASKAAFLTAAQTIGGGVCSAASTVETRDSFDNPAAVAAATAGPLTSTSTTLRFYSDAACTVQITTLTVAAGATTASFHFKDSAGSPTLTWSPTGLTPASQVQTLGVGAPTLLAFVTAAPTLPAGGCTGAIELQTRDALGNGSNVTAATVIALGTSSSGGSFHLTPACGGAAVTSATLAAGTNTVTVYYRDGKAGTATLTATSSPLAAASQIATVTGGASVKLAFTSAPQTLAAGDCSALLTVQPQDAFDNPTALTAAGTLALSTLSPGTGFFSDSSCTAAISSVAMPAGAMVASFFFRSTTTGINTLSAAMSGLATGIQAQTVTPGAAKKLAFFVHPSGTMATAAISPDVQVIAQDDYGNKALAFTSAVTIAIGANPGPGVLSGATSVNAVAGVAVFPGLSIDVRAKGYTLVASSAPLQQATSSPFDVASACTLAITEDALLSGAVGVSYRFNAGGAIATTGALGDVTYSACSTLPAGFQLDAKSGGVFWVPTATGTEQICVRAKDNCGEDTYSYTLTLAPQPAAPPVANIKITPALPQTGDLVAFDGTGSTSDPSATIAGYQWSFGDSSSAAGVMTNHAYSLAGGYTVRLTVFDTAGGQHTAVTGLPVGSAQCPAPPLVRMVADSLTGSNSLTVNFDCNCPAGINRVWDFGDGSSSTEEQPSHTYTPGRYRVRLTGVDTQGCVGTDSVEVVVDKPPFFPPLCVAAVAPNSGPVPLAVGFAARFVDPNIGGVIRTSEWTLPDGATRPESNIRVTIDTPMVYRARLKVTNDHDLSCSDYAEVVAQTAAGESPPQVLSLPTRSASCGDAYHYAPAAGDKPLVRGTRPITWQLGKQVGGKLFGAPEGMIVDVLNGQIVWTPAKGPARKEHVTLVARNNAGATVQEFDIDVACNLPPEDLTGKCGCSGVEGGLAFAGLALMALLRRREKYNG